MSEVSEFLGDIEELTFLKIQIYKEYAWKNLF